MSQGKGSHPSQVTSEQEIESTYYLHGGWGRGPLFFRGSTLSGYFKRCPRKSKAGIYGGNLSSQTRD